MIFIPIHNYLLLACLLIAIIAFSRQPAGPMKWVLPYLGLTCITELTGLYFWKVAGLLSNAPVYNLYISIQGLFLLLLYSKVYEFEWLRKIARLLIVPFLAFSLANLFFYQGFYRFNHYSILFLSFIISFLAAAYYYDYIRSASLTPISKVPFFWVNTGFFLFFLLMLFYWGVFEYMVVRKIDYRGSLFLRINQTANFLLYLNVSIGLLCRGQMR